MHLCALQAGHTVIGNNIIWRAQITFGEWPFRNSQHRLIGSVRERLVECFAPAEKKVPGRRPRLISREWTFNTSQGRKDCPKVRVFPCFETTKGKDLFPNVLLER